VGLLPQCRYGLARGRDRHYGYCWVVPNITIDGITYGTAHSGTYAAWFGDDTGYTAITEWLNTVPGQQYILSFWIMNIGTIDTTPPANWAQVLLSGGSLGSGSNLPSMGWQEVQREFVASLPLTQLEFDFENPPGWFGLDDVSVTPTPEPVTWAFCCAGLGLIVLVRRRTCRLPR